MPVSYRQISRSGFRIVTGEARLETDVLIVSQHGRRWGESREESLGLFRRSAAEILGLVGVECNRLLACPRIWNLEDYYYYFFFFKFRGYLRFDEVGISGQDFELGLDWSQSSVCLFVCFTML